jgi:hypothetical protein
MLRQAQQPGREKRKEKTGRERKDKRENWKREERKYNHVFELHIQFKSHTRQSYA